MSFGVIFIIIVVSNIRKRYQTTATLPELNRKLMIFLFSAIAVLIVEVTVSRVRPFTQWLSMGLVAAFLYLIYHEKTLSPERYLINALVPLVGVSAISAFVELIAKSFYSQNRTWFEAVNSFAVLWAIGVWLVTRKQQKDLNEARKKALEERQNSLLMQEMKAQLEVQVAERTAELQQQKEELEKTLTNLRATQTQLIHSEKMASLGELTAGIAHEIKNPLNFVNNFSDVNRELVEDLRKELQSGNYEEAMEIASSISDNEEKIAYHGSRADAIVKSMLQHSRTGTGNREPTNINELADEYVRLAYHGLRARDKSFNAKFETDFDSSIGPVDLVPQDFGRVLLNLMNNAFYAVNERQKNEGEGYQPVVSIGTEKKANGIQITVSDNGTGMPEEVKNKIFQPFFTTKPTGQGTGLGLSMSYDIVRAHGGTLSVQSKEGEYTRFLIFLPV